MKKRIQYLLFLILFIIGVVPAAAEERPALLFLALAEAERAKEDEKKFVTELRLNLDRYDITKTTVDVPQFEDLAAQFKVEHLYPLFQEHRVPAVLWLSRGSGNVLTLHVATMEGNRANIRLFRQQQGADSAVELARTLSELFESAYLLELEDGTGAAANDVPQQSAPPFEVDSHWYVAATLLGALAGQEGPSLQLHGSTGLLLDVTPHISLKFGVLGGYGPFGTTPTYSLRGFTIRGEIDALLLFDAGSIRLGPIVGFSGGFQSITVKENGRSGVYRYPVIEAKVGASFSVPVGNGRTALAAGVFFSPYRTSVNARTDGDLLYQNQTLGWFVSNEWYFF